MTTNESMAKYIKIHQNAKHGQKIKKLNKRKYDMLLYSKQNIILDFKSYFLFYQDNYAKLKMSRKPIIENLFLVNESTHISTVKS